LIQLFSLDHVAKNPAVFDIDKLNWINSQYLKKLDASTLTEMALPHLKEQGFVQDPVSQDDLDWLTQVVEAVREYISFPAQIPEHAGVFFNDAFEIENEEAAECLKDADVTKVMDALRAKMLSASVLDAPSVQGMLKEITKELKLGGKKVFMPIRVALTGKMHGPELIALIPLIGAERALARIDHAMALVRREG
jgi:nondiscriminating glutamyl-tRNA synthetase